MRYIQGFHGRGKTEIILNLDKQFAIAENKEISYEINDGMGFAEIFLEIRVVMDLLIYSKK